jgi:hypothetical protein
MIILHTKYFRLQQRYRRFMQGASVGNVEQLLQQNLENCSTLKDYYRNLVDELKDQRQVLSTCIQRVAIIRYNPFDDVGGEFSFSAALLDEKNSGLVLTSLFSRKESQIYAKQVIGGQSEHRLSPEEQKVIAQAVGQK